MSITGRCGSKVKKKITLCNLRVMFSITQQQQAPEGDQCKSQEDTDHVLPSCLFRLFLLTGVVKAIFASRRPRVST